MHSRSHVAGSKERGCVRDEERGIVTVAKSNVAGDSMKQAKEAKDKRGKRKGSPKSGGRKKGTPNKRTQYLQKFVDDGFDPFALARQIAAGEVEDTQFIGLDNDGEPKFAQVPLPWAVRQRSIHELMSYLEPKRKALEISTPPGEALVTRIERVILDHTKD